MMRQLVGVRVELARSSARGPRRPARWRPACAPPARRTARAAWRAGTPARAVSFQTRRMVSRSAASRIVERCRSARSGSATARLQQPDQALGQRLDARRVEQVAGIFQHAVDAGRRAVRGAPLGERRPTGRTWRSRPRPAAGARAAPAARAPPPARRSANASITWNSGCRDSERAGLSTSTSRSNGRSWCAVGRQVAARAPARAARGSPDCPRCRCAAPAC